MKKNGAIWVALVVLAAAALLMYFVVLPQVRGSKTMDDVAKKAGETVEQAKDQAKNTLKTAEQAVDTAQQAAEQVKDTAAKTVDQAKDTAGQTAEQAKDTVQQAAADPKAGILQKMARIKASGEEATAEFEALFADNKRPTVEQVEVARAKLEAALKSAREIKATEGLDAQTLDMIDNTSKGAEQALAALEAMPKDVAGAKAAYDALKLTMMAALSGEAKPETSVEPAKQVAALEDAKPAENDDAAVKPSDMTKITPDDADLPAFDVLRVEKDGSTVIAGHALPRSKVEVFDGDKVIASAEAGDGGDFVVVLDNPLPAGDHEIVLQATDRKGVKFRSIEIATVSIPADKAGEVLAMVTKPGEASRIMEMPESGKTEQVVADNSAQPVDNVAVEAKAGQPADAKTEAQAEVKPAQKTDAQPVEIARTEDKAIVTPELPDASDDLANSAPAVKQDDGKAAETALADQAKSAGEVEPQKAEATAEAAKSEEAAKAGDTAASQTTVADASSTDAADTAKSKTARSETTDAAKIVADAATPASVDAKPAAKSLTKPEVLVNAVEIEGNRIFVAGTARPKTVVRVYADDKLVAEVSTDGNGRFVADNGLPLSVGNHTIRADVLSKDGKRVEFRASVPFFRPEGEQLAAVNDATETAADKTMQPLADGDYDKAREEAGKAVSLLKGLYRAGRTPTLEELAAARSATEIALKTLSQIKLSDGDDPVAKEMADKTAGEAAKALALLKSLPQDANAVKTALDSIDDAVTSAVAPTVKTEASSKTIATDKQTAADATVNKATPSKTTEMADDAAEAENVAADTAKSARHENTTSSAANQAVSTQSNRLASADTSETKVIEQAPLKASQSASVIIRRGDTLWQISRRVYGRGVRYTTIYLANEDQISNPDRIMPGQIFGVPDKFLPNSEELHRERLEHRKQ